MNENNTTTDGCLTTFLGGCFTMIFLFTIGTLILGWIFTWVQKKQ